MNSYFTCCSIILVILAFPTIRFLYKRLICLYKISKVCKKNGYRVVPTHPFWFLGDKHSKKCDLYIETETQVFAVKLFGATRRRVALIFKEGGEYYFRRFIAIMSYGSVARFPINQKARVLPNYDFQYNYCVGWQIKTPRRILLVNPVPMEFRRQPLHGSEVIVGAGEIVNGMEIDSLPRLLGDLENAL